MSATAPTYTLVDDETDISHVPTSFQFPVLYRRAPNGSMHKRWFVFNGQQLYSVTGVNEPTYSVLDVKLNSSGRLLHQQAFVIAKASYTKNIDKGYSLSPDAACAPVRLMLAKDSSECEILYPAMVNPKYDGVRCRFTLENGKPVLYTRGGKVIPHLNHIRLQGYQYRVSVGYDLDGELWFPGASFQDIEGIVGSKNQAHTNESYISYYVYDIIIGNVPYDQRYTHLHNVYRSTIQAQDPNNRIVLAPTVIVNNHTELMQYYDQVLALGMEGVMVRFPGNAARNEKEYKRTFYHGTRCNNLVKMKPFGSDEAVVVGVEENTGVAAGTPLFQLVYVKTNPYITFNARCDGPLDYQRQIYASRQHWINRTVVFHYNGKTDNGLSFRHPRVICERTMM